MTLMARLDCICVALLVSCGVWVTDAVAADSNASIKPATPTPLDAYAEPMQTGKFQPGGEQG
jgi:hypothetical protein